MRLGKSAEIVERLKLADFVWVAVARLGELAMVAKVNLTGFEQMEVARLKLDSTGWAVVRLRSNSLE